MPKGVENMVIHNPDEFTKLVIGNFNKLELGTKEIWWRGQSKSKWKLIPGVYRCNRDKIYERNICADFQPEE